MLSTSTRFTQSLDSGVARASVVSASVSAPAAGGNCVNRAAAAALVSTAGYPTAFGTGMWTLIERKPMPKVDLHPDRWPLHSTS